MKIWLLTVVLAFAVAAASSASAAGKYAAKDKTDVDVAVTDVPEADAEVKVETEGEAEEESETEGKEGEKEEGGSNESSSEENEEEEKEQEESSTHTADEEVTTVTVLGYVPVVYTTEAYMKPAYVPTAATYSKSDYIQIPGPVYKPAVSTTEAPKPAVTYNVVKTEITAPAAVVQTVETPKTESKYVKPIVAAVYETTTKFSPIVYEKPSSAPVVTVRKSGWVRAPGYNLGYARSENSDPAVVETPKTSATRSEPLATAKTSVAPLAYRQWLYKPQ